MKLEKKIAPIDQAIFESFKKLISHNEKARIKGASELIKTLEDSSEERVSREIFPKNVLVLIVFCFSYKSSWTIP